ncbi:InlB B-repeat-containing protein, partial [Intestinimonas massiliensis (ex Afouda et al. 2020)]|uniref:InlB B-repeat-containing protein n=1 Tax=Intestinimonas massiliensis (ex Afouda et al. 2020) TaxID=1673721 RepID=UPI001A911D12
QYTITFDSQGGSQVETIAADYGQTVTAPTAPTRTGYTFGGWYTEAGCENLYTFTTMPAQSFTLYAKWTVNQYTITFETGEGTAVEPITQDYGTTVTKPDDPTREGYSFTGWYTEADCTGEPYAFTTMPAENITLYAKWQAGQYTITFDSQGGSQVETIAADYGQTVTAPTAPTRTGYTFGGWYTEADCTGEPYVFTTMPAQSFTLYAKWTVNQYTITFETGEGATAVEPITADYGTAIQAPANPTREGYIFNGWSPELPATMPAENLTLTARWSSEPSGPSGGGTVTVPKYPVNLPQTVDNGTVTADRTTAEAGQTVTLTAKPDQGYTLDSISVTDGSGKLLQLTADGDTYRFTMPGGKVTVAVRFAPLPVELPFTDVDEADWFYDAVAYVYGRELMTGISDTLFAPDQHLTRSMITTVLWRLEGSPAAGTGTVFTDVASDAWYAQAVNWAAAQGIVDGYGNGRFGPEDPITREQLAAILYRYARCLDDDTKAEGDLTGYPDGAQTSDWAVESMTWAVSTGLISGKNGGLLDPTGTATRSEVAALLQRFCESRAK